MTPILQELSVQLGEELTELERTRAVRDLTRVRDRLARHDYRISGFGTNTFDIPDRAQELLTEIAFHASLGRAWAAIFSALDLAGLPSALDLCPGHTPKVELGLFYAGFAGELLVLDRDPTALATLERFLALFAPRFRMQQVVGDLLSVELPPQPLVVGHHLIDDLVLDDHCRHANVPLGSLYRDETAFRAAWSAILADAAPRYERVMARLAPALAARVAPGGVLLLAQYPSYTERLLGLHEASAFSLRLLDGVCTTLAERDFVRLDERVAAAATGVSEFAPASAFRGLRRT